MRANKPIKQTTSKPILNKELAIRDALNPTIEPTNEEEEKNHLTIYHGKATDSLSSVSSKEATIDPITGNALIINDKIKIVMQRFRDLQGTLGVNTHKLLSVAIERFTEVNNYHPNGNGSTEYTVQFSLIEYALNLGYDVAPRKTDTPEEAKAEKKRVNNVLKDVKKKIRKDLDILSSIELTWEETVRGKEGDFKAISIIGSKGISGNYIEVTFDPKMAGYLRQQSLTKYPIRLLRLDARNQTAYILGVKFSTHYNIDNNHKRGTEDKLRVKTLLKNLSLPTYETVKATRKSWEERIKEPFERALDELTKNEILKDWKYTGSKGIPLSDEEATTKNYAEWENFIVQFELYNPPNHNERMERKKIAKLNAAKKTSKK